jgi:hypothetical protein
VPGVPDAWFDGVDESIGGYPGGVSMFPAYNPIVAGNIAEGSPLTITAFFRLATATAGTLFVHVDVEEAVTTTNNIAHFVIVEEGLTTYGITPGLARDMLVDETFTLASPGESVDYAKPFTLDGSWALENIGFVVFVQSHNVPRTVLQAVRAERRSGIRVSPSDDQYAVGDQGGPYDPASVTYAVENLGDSPMDYTVTATQPWITITNGLGTVPGQSSVDVAVEFNMLASMLATGIYEDVLTFTNTTNQLGNTSRNLTLQVGERVLIYSYPLDTSPGWTTWGALWQWGQPTGGGGEFGYPDPTSGYTGPNCYGYNLNGDYENSLVIKHLTTPAMDFTGYVGVEARFWRWLGVEAPAYDRAYFRAGRNTTTWTNIWINEAEVADSTWTQVTYDISAVANGQPAVYLRWSMGPTDGNNRYCGWNIDDVELWGIVALAAGVEDGDGPARLTLYPSSPNPFRDAATIAYALPARARVTVAIYDIAGRLVRQVADGAVEAGPHAVQWDGRDSSGRPVASGVYFCRIDAGGASETQRVVLLK